MSEKQAEINNEVLYFIATGKSTVRPDIESTFSEYSKDEIDTALTSLAWTGYIDCQEGRILATPKAVTRVEDYKATLPRTRGAPCSQ
jgi:hypothetical protein